MKTQTIRRLLAAVSLMLLAVLTETTVSSHHSYAMYDQTKTVTVTGIVRQFVAQTNHAELHFLLVAPDRKGLAKTADGKNIEWGLEMGGAALEAQQGVTAVTFPVGTVFSVKLNPLRDGSNFGSRVGAIAKCPTDAATKRPTLPGADKHCDSVEGRTLLGGKTF